MTTKLDWDGDYTPLRDIDMSKEQSPEYLALLLWDWDSLYQWVTCPGSHLEGSIGESCTNGSCPLAQYLFYRTGIFWSVGPSIRPDHTRFKVIKPAWIQHLIEATDRLTGNKTGSISGKQFLTLLIVLKPEADAWYAQASMEYK